MGREIRKVPPNYEHPKRYCPHRPGCENTEYPHCYQPQHDEHFEDRYNRWLNDFNKIKKEGLSEENRKYYKNLTEWLDDNAPPNLSFCRLYKDNEASWYQVYETVSEGTPVTPPFATKQELINYLVEHGDFWQQKRWREGKHHVQPEPPGYSREAAEAFVNEEESVPTMVIENGVITEGIAVCGKD